MSSATTTPKVSIVIPSWTSEVSRSMRSIEQRTFRDYEVDVAQGVSPSGYARNLGAQWARGEILHFIEDDASLGHKDVLLGGLEDSEVQTR